jgi:hypothetical protein
VTRAHNLRTRGHLQISSGQPIEPNTLHHMNGRGIVMTYAYIIAGAAAQAFQEQWCASRGDHRRERR